MADFVSMWRARSLEASVQTPLVQAVPSPTGPQPPSEAPVAPEVAEAPEVDIEALLAAAHKEGMEKGRKQAEAALAPVRAEMDKEREQVKVLARELLNARQRELDGVRNEVADLVLLMARRVVGDAMAVHPDALRKVVLGAISRVPGEEPVTVRVATADAERVAGWLEAMPRFNVEGCDKVEGGCSVESRYGAVEATIEGAFEALEAATRAWVDEG
jgi:flagellar assembly protein FliH